MASGFKPRAAIYPSGLRVEAGAAPEVDVVRDEM